jgi:hypothetical protein
MRIRKQEGRKKSKIEENYRKIRRVPASKANFSGTHLAFTMLLPYCTNCIRLNS